MRVLLKSWWVGWTNEWAYCWELPRCHGAGSQWTAHPTVLTNGITCMSHTPQVLTGTGPWHVSVCLEDQSPPPSAKLLRQQLKEAFKNGHTLTSHYWKNILSLSLSLCYFFVFWKRRELQTALILPFFHDPTTHTIKCIFLLTHTHIHMLLWCCCANNITNDGWHWWQKEWSGADRAAGGEHTSTETVRHEKWSTRQQSPQQVVWQTLHAFTCI